MVLPFHQRELLPLSKNINYRGRTCNFHGERSSSRGWRGLFNEGIGPRKQSVETLIVISKTTPLYPGQDIMFRECETWKCNHPPLSLSLTSYPNIIRSWYDRFAYWSFGRFVGQLDYGFRSWLEIRHRDKGGCIIILADPPSIRSGKRIFRVSPLILRNCGVTSFATIITVSRLSNATIDDNWRNWRWDLVWFGRGLLSSMDEIGL